MSDKSEDSIDDDALKSLLLAATLANEAALKKDEDDDEWIGEGDAVDITLLAMSRKAGYKREDLLDDHKELDRIAYESSNKFAASFHRTSDESPKAYVKGALEKVLDMCADIDREEIKAQEKQLSKKQYRVLAFASGEMDDKDDFGQEDLKQLNFLGLVGLRDPLREESKGAIEDCHKAGIDVVMITGDLPETAQAIAKELGLSEDQKIISGEDIKGIDDPDELAEKIKGAKVFARIEPKHKLDIVEALKKQGHYVGVTGDGVNDAPALKHAHVGIAMGKTGTDVAKESADIILTNDNFASIVSGVEEGRVAYNNIRKIVFFLVSTGLAEILLFIGAVAFRLPVPLFATQLLWLNFVTNGIQDVAHAFEPKEGTELREKPRDPNEPIFDKLMITRLAITAGTIGTISFCVFYWLLHNGYSEFEARNLTVLQLVLFENVMALNSRSEHQSFFAQPLFKNKLLIFGTIAAQLVHIGAMYTPWLSDVLYIAPVSFKEWACLLGLSLILMVVLEIEKAVRRTFGNP